MIIKKIFSHSGRTEWRLNGLLHRDDGPAIEHWYQHGKLHRNDGPAIKWADGYKNWYLHGKKLTEKEFLVRQQPCESKVVKLMEV